jgi:hypothetical protein
VNLSGDRIAALEAARTAFSSSEIVSRIELGSSNTPLIVIRSSQFPDYDPVTTQPLSICRFRCLLQDTGYPLEVYLPPGEGLEDEQEDHDIDWSRLKERWVGWGIEYVTRATIHQAVRSSQSASCRLPGEQPWASSAVSNVDTDLSRLSLENDKIEHYRLPAAVRGKFPLQGREGNYRGALVKVCMGCKLISTG